MLQLLKPKGSGTHAPQQEKHCAEEPAHCNWRVAPACHKQRKARTATRTQHSQKKKNKKRCASPLTVKKNRIQLCLQWAAALTGPRKPSEKFRFISIPSGHLQPLHLSELQSPSCHTTDKGTKGRSHLASVLGILQFCGLCTMSQRGAATPKDIKGASSPRASSLVLTSGSQ